MALRFLALFLSVSIISYWFDSSIGALSVGTFLPQQFAVVAVFLRLQENIKADLVRVSQSAPSPHQALREEVATG